MNIEVPYIRAVTTTLSLLVVVFVSMESVFHFREQWKNYRSTEQTLGHELVYYRTRCGSYTGLGDEDAFQVLVERCESCLSVDAAGLTAAAVSVGSDR